MLLPLKYAMILAPSMLSYSYIIANHVRLILCVRPELAERTSRVVMVLQVVGASKLSSSCSRQ
jgi:hypothetical protein